MFLPTFSFVILVLFTVLSVIDVCLREYQTWQTYEYYKDQSLSQQRIIDDLVKRNQLEQPALERSCAGAFLSLVSVLSTLICPLYAYWMYTNNVGNHIGISICLGLSLVAWAKFVFRLRKLPRILNVLANEIGDLGSLGGSDRRAIKNIADELGKEVTPVQESYAIKNILGRVVTNLSVLAFIYMFASYMRQ